MKNIVRIILSMVAWLMLANLVAAKLEADCNVYPAVTIAAMFVLTLVLESGRRSKFEDHIYRCDPTVDVNIWAKEIIKRLFKNNMFLNYAQSDNKYVIGGAAVLIPQPGTRPTVVKNRSSFPATAVRRSDTVILYALDEYSTDPTHVTLNELATISYNKMDSVIQDLFGYLLQDVADDMIIKWATDMPEANLVYTTGADTAALESGQTGLRKSMVWQDLNEANRVMNKANVLQTGRVALIEENMYQQLVDSLGSTQYKDFSRSYDPATGTLGRLFNFDIMTRSSVAMAASALDSGLLDVNALDAAIAADDNVVSLCWQRDVVANATGSVNLFNRSNDPLYYGDINSTSIRAGGRVRRADSAGIVAIVQAPAATN